MVLVLMSTPTPPQVATARSSMPSPLKSPIATKLGDSEPGVVPATRFRGAWKVPSPLPSSTETLPERGGATYGS